MIHELAHAIEHKTHLNRNLSSDKLSYAQEELVAAFVEILILSDFSLKYYSKNHQVYINSWIALITDKSKALFKAMNDAEVATNYFYENCLKKSNGFIKYFKHKKYFRRRQKF